MSQLNALYNDEITGDNGEIALSSDEITDNNREMLRAAKKWQVTTEKRSVQRRNGR